MDLNSLKILVEISRQGSLSGAARQLGMTKSKVSRKLAELERDLGQRLITRSTRALYLSQEGQRLVHDVAPALSDIDQAAQGLGDIDAPPSGTLRLTAPLEFGSLLGPLLSDFAQQYPTLSIEVELADRMVDLVSEGFDLAFRVGPMPDSTLRTRKLDSLERLLVASPSYLQQRGRPRTPEDLLQHDALLFSGAVSQRAWQLSSIEGKKQAVTLRPSGRVVINSFATLRDLATAGMGVALVPAFVVEQDLRQHKLERVLPGWAASTGELYAVHAYPRLPPPRLRVFLQHLEAHLADRPWAKSGGQVKQS